jgi:hypothetical protein
MSGQFSDRDARADRYFEQDLKGQRDWYGRRASSYKTWTQLLGLAIIGAGAATTFVQVFTPATWVPVLTAALGALVALAEGWQRITRYSETWVAYRTASERMKRERRLYVNGVGAYRGLDDDAAFLQLVESVEAILAEEQQVYWRNRGTEGSATRQTGTTAFDKAGER